MLILKRLLIGTMLIGTSGLVHHNYTVEVLPRSRAAATMSDFDKQYDLWQRWQEDNNRHIDNFNMMSSMTTVPPKQREWALVVAYATAAHFHELEQAKKQFVGFKNLKDMSFFDQTEKDKQYSLAYIFINFIAGTKEIGSYEDTFRYMNYNTFLEYLKFATPETLQVLDDKLENLLLSATIYVKGKDTKIAGQLNLPTVQDLATSRMAYLQAKENIR